MTEDLPAMAEEICPGFPNRCPNLRTIEPEPGVHLGGVRCGCADPDVPPAAAGVAPAADEAERRDRYAVAIHDATEADLSLVDQEPGVQALIACAADAAIAVADAEQAELRACVEQARVTIERVTVEVEEAEHHREQTHAPERTDCVMCGSDHMADVRAALDTAVPPAAAPAVDRADDSPVNDMRELYALQHAIRDAGSELTRDVHQAVDGLREVWDREVRRLQGVRRMATEAQQQPDPRPAATEWRVEGQWPDGDWREWSGAHHDPEAAQRTFDTSVRGTTVPVPLRLVRATTTYTVEAEHTPQQQPAAADTGEETNRG